MLKSESKSKEVKAAESQDAAKFSASVGTVSSVGSVMGKASFSSLPSFIFNFITGKSKDRKIPVECCLFVLSNLIIGVWMQVLWLSRRAFVQPVV